MRLPYRFRRIHRAWAELFGYFWLPCPMCKRPFGGHEWGGEIPDPASGPGRGKGVCRPCGALLPEVQSYLLDPNVTHVEGMRHVGNLYVDIIAAADVLEAREANEQTIREEQIAGGARPWPASCGAVPTKKEKSNG